MTPCHSDQPSPARIGISRREWLGRAMAIVAVALAAPTRAAAGRAVPITVYKTATCTCCAKWVDHLAASGFAPDVHVVDDVGPEKDRLHVPAALRTCHTAVVEPYAVEGHVPADVIQQLLRERPPGVVGIGVAGMPLGSPGMDGEPRQPYDVMAFDAAGETRVYARR